ncbi:hypothetical protein Q4E93_02530 [Flavitalea sp. BT771]|uniref:hypothetical protein n=1 Tax=Flavitalea sp. BT771 TaxID=3063329 RepID=UPI0026E2FC80|nr:hypothetical protein [Flavitalea sp. BT771]MDO6429447.1 hypothetical protein [Flavitalea sp. BT771]MDV6218425.1 hypothetical protein [Flavitalea sp. BT771]
MKVSLPQKRYSIPIIPSLLLLLLLFSDVVRATPACPIVTQTFQNSANGDLSDPSATGWYLDRTNVTNAVVFSAQSHRIKAQTLGGEGVWYSQVFSIAGYTNVQVDAKISSEGSFTSSEYVKVYYKLNNGPETLINAYFGSFGTPTVTSPMLTGSTVQIVIRIYNVSAGNNDYYIEKYDVFKETGPCTVSGISVSASASNSGVLTCNNPSTTLSASTTASGTTTYAWTGPNGYAATGSSVSVSTAGNYTVTGTNSAGTGSASVTVTANNSAPDLAATGGNMACASSITISASSSVSGATYSWTGPNGFTSTAQNPTVTAAGTYTVTVRNPATGCTASTSATVTAGTATATTFWLEDFTLANGTTSDAGSTPWTATHNVTSGSYTYSVQNNEFKTSFPDQFVGTWTSGKISLAGKTNIKMSVDLRSEVASGKSLENEDYIKVYLRINNRADSLIYQDLAGIGSSTTGTASMTLTSGTFNGDSVRVIIKTSNSDASEIYYFDNVKLTGTSAAASVIASVTGIVTCTNTAQLSATASGTVTGYSWTGPNSFTSTAQNPVVSAGGVYTVTATLSGGCTVSAPVTVTENKTAPDITAIGGSLTCLSTITLSASSSVSGATYSWSGPNSFTSTAQNPVVSAAGTYTATVTNPANGCTASQSVTVSSGITSLWLENFTFANGTISDAGTTPWSVQSTPSGSVFSVQNNEFRVSNTGTGTGTESVWASGTIDISGKTNVSISAGIRSSVTNNAAMNTSGSTMDYLRFYYKINGGSEVLFSETLAAVNNHSTTNTTISVGSLSGTNLQIIVRARATGSDEFYYFDNVQVSAISGGNISATASSGATITCTNTSVALSGNASVPGVTYAWTGPNGFSSTVQNPTVTAGGIYTLTVSANGCSASDTALVVANTTAPGATGSAASSLSCTRSSVALSGASSTSGVTYAWAGPGNFTSATQNPTVSTAGVYTLTVTNPVNGCTSSDTANVLANTTAPTGVTASANGSLTCTSSSVALTGASSTTGVTYAWTGPGNFTSTTQNPTVSTAGVYTLTVTNPANGCTATDTANVLGSTTAPATPTTSANPASAKLTCATNVVNLSGGSTTAGVTYTWTGPNNFNVASSQTNVFNAGTYTLTATNPANGCTASTAVVVTQNITPPNLAPIAPSTATLTCANPSVTLTGVSSTGGVSYTWSGPNSFTASGTTAVATSQGAYILTVTDPSNGCTNTTTATVGQNFTAPAGVIAYNNGPLTCAVTSVTITGNSSTPGVTYSWTGPNGFTASTITATTSAAGTYTLTVTNPVNGCTAITNTVVAQSISAPGNLSVASSTGANLLTCTTPSISLTASSSTTGLSFSWSGPNGFTASSASITVGNPGTYLVTATDPSNGCSSNNSANVAQNITPPANLAMVSNPVNARLTCSTSNIGFNASSSAAGANYTWSGPGGFSTTGMSTVVTAPGTYTVTATDPVNGCISTSSAIVTQDTVRPTAVATSSVPANGLLTCSNTNVVLTGSSSSSGVIYSWTGPSGFVASGSSATVTIPGNYTVTVTNPNNGCSTSATAAPVTQNTHVPEAVSASVNDKLTCNTTSVKISGSSNTTGVTFAWTGPSGFTSSSKETMVTAGGLYTLTATDPSNGCSFSRQITVQADQVHPQGVTITSDGSLSCTVGSVNLTGGSSTAGVSYTWTGPNGFFDPEQITSVTDSGTYFLTVRNGGNGCTTIASIPVTADFTECSMAAPKVATGHATTLGAADGSTPVIPGLTYKVYPNPANSTAIVELNAPGKGHVSVEVYNGVGVREKVLFDGNVEAGTPYRWTLDAGSLATGMHYCMIRTNNKVYVSKLLIAR